MAETAQSIITDALQEILVQATEQPIEPSEFQSGIRYLNRMMNQWEANGMDLGYVEVANPGDRITVLPGAIEAMIFNLAIKLAPQYDITPSPLLILNAREAKKAVRKLTYTLRPSVMPSTLPIGSGNEQSINTVDYKFYPVDDIPSDAEELKVGEIDSYSLDFSLYLLDGATISSYTVTPNQYISVLADVEDAGIITISAKALSVGRGELCVKITTSNGRAEEEKIIFAIKAAC